MIISSSGIWILNRTVVSRFWSVGVVVELLALESELCASGFGVIWFWGLGSALWIPDSSSGLNGLALGLG